MVLLDHWALVIAMEMNYNELSFNIYVGFSLAALYKNILKSIIDIEHQTFKGTFVSDKGYYYKKLSNHGNHSV